VGGVEKKRWGLASEGWGFGNANTLQVCVGRSRESKKGPGVTNGVAVFGKTLGKKNPLKGLGGGRKKGGGKWKGKQI